MSAHQILDRPTLDGLRQTMMERRHCLLRAVAMLLDEARSANSTLDVSDLLDDSSPVAIGGGESFALAERAQEMLREIDLALDRMAAGTYGGCGDCGEPIPVERLLALPATAVCVACRRHRDLQQTAA